MGGHELFEERPGVPVRCIICNRIKQPLGAQMTPDLHGMRCDLSCPGYTLDPPPIEGSMTFLTHPMSASTGAGSRSDALTDVIGRALCEVHFGV